MTIFLENRRVFHVAPQEGVPYQNTPRAGVDRGPHTPEAPQNFKARGEALKEGISQSINAIERGRLAFHAEGVEKPKAFARIGNVTDLRDRGIAKVGAQNLNAFRQALSLSSQSFSPQSSVAKAELQRIFS